MPDSQSKIAKTPANLSAIDKFFKITERGSTVGREVRGGLVTFFAMAYILVVNAAILSNAVGKEIPMTSITAGTALVAAAMTLIMGVFANYPMAIAAGMGLNAVVAFTLANPKALGLSYDEAMGLIFWEGLAITILVLTGFREAVFKAIPSQLKTAISVGIGLFIALIGLVDAGVVRTAGTPVSLGVNGALLGWPIATFFVGLIVIIVLYIRRVPGAILIGIVVSTIMALVVQKFAHLGSMAVNPENDTFWKGNVPELHGNPVALPSFESFGHIDFFDVFTNPRVGAVGAVLLIFSLMIADFFDTMGTMVAVGSSANLLDKDGVPPGSKRILLVDGLSAIAGGLGGVSSNTAYVESTAGTGDGARTGLSSVVVSACFALSLFFAPLVEMVPAEASNTALVFVGFLMMVNVMDIDWHRAEYALPAFMTIAFMPFTYSITAGIGFGFITFVVVRVAQGQARRLHPLMWLVSLLFLLYFCLPLVQQLVA